MSRADSPLRGRMIFNFGARRSGTYWLQRIITAHPDVAEIPSEPALFSHGIAPLFERFTHSSRGNQQVGKMFVERDVLLDATREFCDRILAGFATGGEDRIAERTPQNAMHLELIAEIYPDARYIHIIRDGRDVARSLATKSWGPGSVASAAREWRDSITAVHEAPRPDHYLEVRYEDILSDPRLAIERLYTWLELPVSESTLDAGLRVAGVQRNIDFADPRVQVAKWRSALGPDDLRSVTEVAGGLLAELGYVNDSDDEPRRHERRPAERKRRPLAEAGARVRGVARRARRQRAGRSPIAEGYRAPIMAVMEAFEVLLSALHTGDAAGLGGQLAPDVECWIDSSRGGRRVVGANDVAASLLDDPIFRGRQLKGAVYSGFPTSSAVFTYIDDRERRHDRTVIATFHEGKATFVGVHLAGDDEPAPEKLVS